MRRGRRRNKSRQDRSRHTPCAAIHTLCARTTLPESDGYFWRAVLLALTLTMPACQFQPASEGPGGATQTAAGAGLNPAQPTDADAPRPQAPDPIEVDAERVLAAMPAAWREMLARAEDFHHRERVGWCITCHVNIRDQMRGGGHDKNSIHCVECHGPSERHARDENNDIKPDQKFARADVDRVCGDCHDCSRPAPAQAAATTLVCTDCHPAHGFPNLAQPQPK